MKRFAAVFFLCLSVFFVAAPARAGQVLLSAGSTWEYTFTDPTADTTWNKVTGTGGWLPPSAAPFGNNRSGYSTDPNGYFNYNTYWAPDTSGSWDDDLWVRTTFDATGVDLSDVVWHVGVDNGFTLYLNGHQVTKKLNAESYTYRWEYSGVFGEYLHSGVNVIAVALEDHGGLTAFDMQVEVPDGGATLTLLGGALIALGIFRRKMGA